MNVYQGDPLQRVFLVALTFSLLVHIVIFVGPWKFFNRERKVIYSPYKVKLVGSLPAGGGSKSGSRSSMESKKNVVRPSKKSVVIPQRSTHKKVLSTSKKKAIRHSVHVRKKKKVVEKDELNLSEIGNFIKELKKKNKGEGTENDKSKGKGDGGELVGARAFSVLQRAYFNDLIERIKDEWILPPQLKNEKRNLVVIVAVTIAADGRILRAVIEKSSGNVFYDESALRAVKKLGKLPPPPFNKDKITIGLRFNLRELQR